MRTVRIAELKARLSEFLRAVRRGDRITVLDRDTPVAQIVPCEAASQPLTIRQPRRRYGGLHDVPLPRPLKTKTDVVALLLEERQVDR
jgi:prevent-host-death family protein